MAIRQLLDKESIWDKEPYFVVSCDVCRKQAPRAAKGDHGEAAEKARRYGFQTVRVGTLSDPKEWRCPDCLRKEKGNGASTTAS